MDILFKNVTVVTMNPEVPVIYNANVGICGRKIAYLSDCKTTPAPASARVINGENKVLMPGLYNCHTHAAMTLLRGYANDRALEDWLFNYIFPAEKKLTPSLVRIGTQLAIAEMVSSGTLAFTDMYFFCDEVARVADETGVLANVCNAVIAFDKDVLYKQTNEYEQTLSVLGAQYNKGDGRVKVEASIHGVYTSYEPMWHQVRDFAAEHKLSLHIHLSETKTEHENCVSQYGGTPAQVFNRHGVFDVPCIAAHAVWVTEEDMRILADKNVHISHNPLSNLKLASGLAPVNQMLAHNINVTLGTDGMAANNTHDLFEEMKMASLLQKYACMNPTITPAQTILEMATINGAKSQGRHHESGKIEVGYDADVLLMDFDNPRQTACHDPRVNLAYSTTGRDVQMTICRGRVLYENGEYKTIDIEKLLHEARAAINFFRN